MEETTPRRDCGLITGPWLMEERLWQEAEAWRQTDRIYMQLCHHRRRWLRSYERGNRRANGRGELADSNQAGEIRSVRPCRNHIRSPCIGGGTRFTHFSPLLISHTVSCGPGDNAFGAAWHHLFVSLLCPASRRSRGAGGGRSCDRTSPEAGNHGDCRRGASGLPFSCPVDHARRSSLESERKGASQSSDRVGTVQRRLPRAGKPFDASSRTRTQSLPLP